MAPVIPKCCHTNEGGDQRRGLGVQMDGGGRSRLGFLWPPREILLDSRRDASLTPNSNPFYSMGTGLETPSSAQKEKRGGSELVRPQPNAT